MKKTTTAFLLGLMSVGLIFQNNLYAQGKSVFQARPGSSVVPTPAPSPVKNSSNTVVENTASDPCNAKMEMAHHLLKEAAVLCSSKLGDSISEVTFALSNEGGNSERTTVCKVKIDTNCAAPPCDPPSPVYYDCKVVNN